MSINNLFFYIHYCGSRQPNEPWKYKPIITRILEHHELIFITGGNGNIIIENKRYQAKEGMVFYICSDTLQSIESDIKNPLYFISVHFSYASVLFNDNRLDIKRENNILPLSPMEAVKDYYQINYIFRRLVNSWNEKLPAYELITTALLQQLIFENYSHKKRESGNYSVSLKIENIIKYMHENINGRLTLTELAQRVQLSPTYLSKVFKDNTGYSLIGFFNKMKIDKAKDLIIEGNKKIKEAAHEVGFSDEFYFSRIFKKIEGISPAEFYSKNVHGV
ncbi:MAG: btr 2 [Clostridiaceae bacterium]|jgi:YesN/AraC family two-component response regulator|nr:btr 2 [Clostridiaceae bacterium]